MPKTPNEEIEAQAGASDLLPILDHLAWLAECVADEANADRAYDAALLTYNAAVMLEWRFRFPLGEWTLPLDRPEWAEAAKLMDDLSMSSRAIVEKVKTAPKKEADAYRAKLRARIKRVLKRLPDLLSVRTPTPAYMAALNESPNVRMLMGEFLEAHRDEYTDAIAEGKAAGKARDVGPEAALSEAVASLLYVHTSQGMKAQPADLRRSLGQMAVGFLKTAVEDLPDGVSPAQRKRWRRLAKWLASDGAAPEVK